MSFRVKREDLLQSLNRVSPGLSNRAFVEQSTCFVFSGGYVLTYNEEICCRSKIGFPNEIRGAVHAKTLTTALENMRADDIEVWVEDGHMRLIGGKEKGKSRDKVGIRMQAEILLPVEQVERPESWADLPEEFTAAIAQVSPVAGNDEQEFITVCVHIHPEWVEATDRKQIIRYEVATGVEKPFLVRAKSIAHVAELGLTRIGETPNWVHFRNKTLIFSVRRHLDAFPSEQITKLLDFSGAPTTLPRGAAEAAKLGGVFSSEDKENDKVKVRLAEGHMTVRGDGRFGWGEAEMEVSYEDDPVSFTVSPAMLQQLVKNHTDCEIATGKLCVRGEKWTYLTVLGSVEDTPTIPVATEEESEPVGVGAGEEEEQGD